MRDRSTRRVKRSEKFDITLEVKDQDFIRPPREAQRNWLLNRALKEMNEDLTSLHQLAPRFVPGGSPHDVQDRAQAMLGEQAIMEDWQIPIMRTMAELVASNSTNVLEIGFGRGIASAFLQESGVETHTIVECNDQVVDRFKNWQRSYPDSDIRLLHGRWQDVLETVEAYDAVFFHTYPLDQNEYVELALKSATFAEHFFSTAADCLVSGGRFTYLTNEIDSLSRGHQRALLSYFQSFQVSRVELSLPEDVRDAWWADSMMVVVATK